MQSNFFKPVYVLSQPENVSRIRRAFPLSLSDKVDSILAIVPVDVPVYLFEPSPDDIGSIKINSEEVHIPYRIQWPEAEKKDFANLDSIQKLIVSCLYTRHKNGYVREKYLDFLFTSNQDWVPPFVLQLLAEYVIQIPHKIENNISYLDRNIYSRFALENPMFIRLCQEKMISYWDSYYRFYRSIPLWTFQDYPSCKVFKSLGIWTGHEGKRLLRNIPKLP
jgi:hypothetical protein